MSLFRFYIIECNCFSPWKEAVQLYEFIKERREKHSYTEELSAKKEYK
jgi:hypothetical protein